MNLMMLLEMAASGLADRIAVGSRDGGLTYAALFDRAGATARRLRANEVDAAVLCDESSRAVPLTLFGAAWAGVPYVPLNYRLPEDDLLALAGRVGTALAVTDETNLSRLAAVDDVSTVLRDTFLADPSDGTDAGAAPGDWGMDPDDVAVLLFTSGTTGTPKSAVLRHRHLVSYILGSVEFMGAGEDEATLVSVPPYHIAGVAAILSSVYAGRRIVQLPRFDPDAWIDTVEAEGVTHAMVVPTMLTRIVDALVARGGEPMLGLRALSYGGGKMPRPVIEQALELFPITNFVNAYGLTETSSTIALLGPDEHRVAQYSDDPAERARLASVGRPLPGVEVALLAMATPLNRELLADLGFATEALAGSAPSDLVLALRARDDAAASAAGREAHRLLDVRGPPGPADAAAAGRPAASVPSAARHTQMSRSCDAE